jgi:hypothetical protein
MVLNILTIFTSLRALRFLITLIIYPVALQDSGTSCNSFSPTLQGEFPPQPAKFLSKLGRWGAMVVVNDLGAALDGSGNSTKAVDKIVAMGNKKTLGSVQESFGYFSTLFNEGQQMEFV